MSGMCTCAYPPPDVALCPRCTSPIDHGPFVVLAPADQALVTRIVERLRANGVEANRLRSRLLVALVDAAELAGDKAEARAYAMQLHDFARATRATTNASPTRG